MAISISERPNIADTSASQSALASEQLEKPTIKTIDTSEATDAAASLKTSETKDVGRDKAVNLAKPKQGFLERVFSGIKLPWFRKKEDVQAETSKAAAEQPVALPTSKVFLPTDFDNIIAMKNHKYTKEDFKKFGLPERFLPLSHTADIKGKKVEILENVAWQQLAYDLYNGFVFKEDKNTLEPQILNNRYISVVVTRNPYEMAKAKLDTIESPILNSLKPTLVSREQLGTEAESKELAQYSPNKGRFSPVNRTLHLLGKLLSHPNKTISQIKEFGVGAASLKPPAKWTRLLMPNSEFTMKDGKKVDGAVPILLDDTPNNYGGNKVGDGYQPEFLVELRDPKKFIDMTINSGIDAKTGVFDARKTTFYQRLVKELILPLEEKGPEEFLKSKKCETKPEELKAVMDFKKKHEGETVKDKNSGEERPLLAYQAIHNANQSGVYEQEFLGEIKMSQLKKSA